MPFESKIEINPETGTKCLIVYYDSEKNNFNETIEAARKQYDINSGQMMIIAMPERLRN